MENFLAAIPLVAAAGLVLVGGVPLGTAAAIGSMVGAVELTGLVGIAICLAHGSSGVTGDPAQDGAIAESRAAALGDGGAKPTLGDLPSSVQAAAPDATAGGPLEDDGRRTAQIVTPPAGEVQVYVSPAAVQLEKGTASTLAVSVIGPDGAPMAAAVDWTTTDPGVASVAAGVVTAVGRGVAQVRATDVATGRWSNALVVVYEYCGGVPLQAGNACCPDGTQAATCPLTVARCFVQNTYQCFEERTTDPAGSTMAAGCATIPGAAYSLEPCPAGAAFTCVDPSSDATWQRTSFYYPPQWVPGDAASMCGP
jgi:hypothetical protein